MSATVSSLVEQLPMLAGNPLLLFTTLFLLTFVLEDAIAVAAGVLAGQMLIDPGVALLALVLGTIAGDLALYAGGRWLSRTRTVARLLRRGGEGPIEKVRSHGLIAVLVARFVPGTRLPVFLSSGAFRLPFAATALVIGASTLVWTPGLFYLSHQGGGLLLSGLHPILGLGAGALVLLALFVAPRLVRQATA